VADVQNVEAAVGENQTLPFGAQSLALSQQLIA
jgi:hypothetical protein